MPSPLSNAEKLAESSRREEEFRREREREREESVKAYHERESRVPLTSQQRKGNFSFALSIKLQALHLSSKTFKSSKRIFDAFFKINYRVRSLMF